MPSKYQMISELAVLTAEKISSGVGSYMDFFGFRGKQLQIRL